MKTDVTAVPIDNEHYAVNCNECGAVSVETVESVHDACIAHLKDNHEATKVQWRVGDTRWTET